jgi:hypothetical protein
VATFVIGHKSSKVAERDPALPLFLDELSAPNPPHRIAHLFSGFRIDSYSKAPMQIIHRPLDAGPSLRQSAYPHTSRKRGLSRRGALNFEMLAR